MQTPFHDEVTSKCSESNSQFSHNKGASFIDLENGHVGEVTAQNQLQNSDRQESLASLTDEITKLKSLMREEVEELQRINEEKEKK